MDNKQIENINKQVIKKYPEVKGIQPTLTPRPGDQVLLVYKASAQTADGRLIDRVVRVVVDDAGKIIKMSTSK